MLAVERFNHLTSLLNAENVCFNARHKHYARARPEEKGGL